MNPQDAVDLSREAIKTCMMVGGPILVASLAIGLIVGVIQAMTQVQDQTVSFVPKALILLALIGLCLPWLTERMMDFARTSFETPMILQSGLAAAQPDDPEPTYSIPDRTARLPARSVNDSIPVDSPSSSDAPLLPSPFVLPHYRFSKPAPSEIGG